MECFERGLGGRGERCPEAGVGEDDAAPGLGHESEADERLWTGAAAVCKGEDEGEEFWGEVGDGERGEHGGRWSTMAHQFVVIIDATRHGPA